jgi:DNA-binding transcriptional regulator YdaS (Cro superfamily)
MGRAAIAKAGSEVKREEVKQDIRKEYIKRMGPEVLDPKSFEMMIITAVKA